MMPPDFDPSAKSDARRFESVASRSDAVRPRVKSMATVGQMRRFMGELLYSQGPVPGYDKMCVKCDLKAGVFCFF